LLLKHLQTAVRLRSPQPQNDNILADKDLQQPDTSAYKPAYKKVQKTAGNHPQSLPTELAEIVAVWPELPAHIKAAIKALVQTSMNQPEEVI